MRVLDAIEKRRAIAQFDPSFELTDEAMVQLMKPVCLTPSSFNLQHWRFVAIRNLETKKLLRQASFNQRQVEECAAVIVVTADTQVHEHAKDGWKNLDGEVAERLDNLVRELYADNPQLQRDEAIRSGSLAAMTMMLIATEMGLDTSPMIGFDPQSVAGIAQVPDDYVIVMLVCVGKALADPRPSMGRFEVAEVVRLESFDGDGLGDSNE